MPYDPAPQAGSMLLSDRDVSNFFDGTMTDPQLDHAEGLAIDAARGILWCGGERGQVYCLDLATKSFRQVASTGGFCLGMALDGDGALYICDSRHGCIMKYQPDSGEMTRFADGIPGRRLKIPNYPAFGPDGLLYVSDSFEFKDPGPGIFRFKPDGTGELWCDEPFDFANGLAFSPDGHYLYVAESYPSSISRIPINPDGSAGSKEHVARIGQVPDGLAFDQQGRLYIACYEPSAIYRYTPESGLVETVYHDLEAVSLCHPTNVAFYGKQLFAVNLGKCHITCLDLGVAGSPLPPQRS